MTILATYRFPIAMHNRKKGASNSKLHIMKPGYRCASGIYAVSIRGFQVSERPCAKVNSID